MASIFGYSVPKISKPWRNQGPISDYAELSFGSKIGRLPSDLTAIVVDYLSPGDPTYGKYERKIGQQRSIRLLENNMINQGGRFSPECMREFNEAIKRCKDPKQRKELAVALIKAAEVLDLSGSQVTPLEVNGLLSTYQHIRGLDLSSCRQMNAGWQPGIYPNMHLHTLILAGNFLWVTNKWLEILVFLPDLEVLNLYGCFNITDTGLESVSKLPKLRRLDLSECAWVSETGMTHVAKLTHLQQLKLVNCWKIDDASLERLSSLRELTELDVTGCFRITKPGRASIDAFLKKNAALAP